MYICLKIGHNWAKVGQKFIHIGREKLKLDNEEGSKVRACYWLQGCLMLMLMLMLMLVMLMRSGAYSAVPVIGCEGAQVFVHRRECERASTQFLPINIHAFRRENPSCFSVVLFGEKILQAFMFKDFWQQGKVCKARKLVPWSVKGGPGYQSTNFFCEEGGEPRIHLCQCEVMWTGGMGTFKNLEIQQIQKSRNPPIK